MLPVTRGSISIKKRVFEIIEKGKPGDRASRHFDLFLVLLILLNVVAIIIASVKSIYNAFPPGFIVFEVFSVVVFTVEYALRVWTAEYKVKAQKRAGARIKYIFTPMALIDLLAILPFYLPFFYLVI